MSTSSPIGFFDSGVGGLSVYSRFRKLLPAENTIYYGDLANMPYGNKSKDELINIARNILNFMREKQVKAVVIACNTSSAVAYEAVKDDYDFKIYPIIQSCSEVISKMNIDRAGVFATQVTVNTGAYSREIKKYNNKIEVIEIACPKWTSFVEEDKINSIDAEENVKLKVNEILRYNPQKIILGCTHYPYLKDVLKKFAPAEIFVDPAQIFVEFIKDNLMSSGLISTNNEHGHEVFYVSSSPDSFVKNSKLFYNVHSEPILLENSYLLN